MPAGSKPFSADMDGSVSSSADLHAHISEAGFAFLHGPSMRALLAQAGPLSDWEAFANSWDDLGVDRYMADGGRYRRRRHAVYEAADRGPIARQPHQPHFQSTDYNPLHGGIARWFDPVANDLGAGPSLTTVLTFCRTTFSGFAPSVRAWRIEAHQFRIEARAGEQGRPTPEGLHRDGVDYVLVLLVNRRNIASGTTTVHALDGRTLGQFTLAAALDAALLDDTRVAHGVTPIEPVDPATPAYRDVLVVTWRAE
jgi:hypothetical protein